MRFRSRDGLCSSADPAAVALWEEIGARMEHEQREWNALLRSIGVVAAHPDDGWVKRHRQPPEVHFEYPQFLDRQPQVGDLIALGSAHHSGEFEGDPKRKLGYWRYRICRVTAINTASRLLTYYEFEDTDVRWTNHGPVSARRKRWWQR